MFKCGQCGRQTAPGEKATMKILKRRPKDYPAMKVGEKYFPGGSGWEIEKEIKIGACCNVR